MGGPQGEQKEMPREEWLRSVLVRPRTEKEADIEEDLHELILHPEGDVITNKAWDVAAVIFRYCNPNTGVRRAVVVFRGTQSGQNVRDDCRICKVPLDVLQFDNPEFPE